MAEVQSVGMENFESEVLRAAQPVVVDFWAERCQPCQLLAPVLEQVAQTFAGRLKIVKCNVDDHPRLAIQYGIRAVPNLIFFRNGEVVDQAIGSMSARQLSNKIEAVLDREL